ncbi:hypothetical protein NOF63_10060, partial [Limosilactobacillus fermentum]
GYDTGSNQSTSASVTMSNGGDLQASTISANGVIYASCHCSDGSYQDKRMWEAGHDWSRVDEIKWVGAWDATTGEHLHWTPFELLSQRRTGAWALTTDTNGNLWVGGDFTLSHIDASRSGTVALPDATHVTTSLPRRRTQCEAPRPTNPR